MSIHGHSRRTQLAVVVATLVATGLSGCATSGHSHAVRLTAETVRHSSPVTPTATTGITARPFNSRIRAQAVVPRRTPRPQAHPIKLPKRGTPAHTRPTVAAHREPAPAQHYAARAFSAPRRAPHSGQGGAIPPPAGHARRHSKPRHSPVKPGARATEHGRLSDNPNEAGRGSVRALGSVDPCRYLSSRQAASALGVASVSAREAPLGPTCVFTPRSTRTKVTLSVQVIQLKRELQRMRHESSTRVAGHLAYCGTLGQALLLMPLSRYYVLEITAGCRAAKAMARAALPRLRA
jgi:hypothetical protein